LSDIPQRKNFTDSWCPATLAKLKWVGEEQVKEAEKKRKAEIGMAAFKNRVKRNVPR
jgi:hypothetical protein